MAPYAFWILRVHEQAHFVCVHTLAAGHFGSRQPWFPTIKPVISSTPEVCEGDANDVNARADIHLRVCRFTGDGLSQDSGSTYSRAPCDPSQASHILEQRRSYTVGAQSESSTEDPVTTQCDGV